MPAISSAVRATSPGTPTATSSSPTATAPNARIAKFDRNGRFLLSWGSRGSDAGQFNTPHSIATDAQGNVYVADQGNKRIQVFDNGGTFKSQITNVGVPTALCISRGSHPYLYSSHTGDAYGMDDAAIYKLELDGRIVGKFGQAGKQLKEFGLVNAIDCRTENDAVRRRADELARAEADASSEADPLSRLIIKIAVSGVFWRIITAQPDVAARCLRPVVRPGLLPSRRTDPPGCSSRPRRRGARLVQAGPGTERGDS